MSSSSPKLFPIFGGIFDPDLLTAEIQQITEESAAPGFWQNPRHASELLRKKRFLEKDLSAYHGVSQAFEEIQTLYGLVSEEADVALLTEAQEKSTTLSKVLEQLQMAFLFTDEKDRADAVLEINAGAGGTESCDWAAMLFRMYVMWARSHNFDVEVLEEMPGEGAGIKHVTVVVKGDRAYGMLKTEVGVHRLVRISPFDANKRRHTSFCSVYVYPDIEEDVVIEINPADLRVDTFRASGAGGQHVNKTDSAVRITHIPTNVVVQCQNERSQHKNRDRAMKLLRAKLYDIEMQKRAAQEALAESQKSDISWGNQIRSYVLHPYRLVKDHRIDLENTNADAVLDGEIDAFVYGILRSWIKKEKRGT